MIYRLKLLKNSLELVYEGIFSALLITFFSIVYEKENVDIRAYIVIGVLYVLSLILMEIAPNYVILVLPQLIPAAVCYAFAMPISIKVVITLITFHRIFETYAYAKRNNELKPIEDLPWPTLASCIVAYFFGYYVKSEYLMNMSYIVLLLLLIIYFVQLYIDGLHKYVKATKDVRGLPIKHIVGTNNIIVVVIIAAFLLSIICARLLHLEILVVYALKLIRNIFAIIAGGFMLLMTFISGFFKLSDSGIASSDETVNDTQMDFSYVAADSLEILLKLFVAALIVYIVYRFLMWTMKKLLQSRTNPNDIIETADDKHMDTKASKKKRKSLSKYFSPDEKIRRMYKQKVERYRYDVILSDKKSCADIEEDISALQGENRDDMSEITEIYKKIRYSGNICDKSLVTKMGNLTKN